MANFIESYKNNLPRIFESEEEKKKQYSDDNDFIEKTISDLLTKSHYSVNTNMQNEDLKVKNKKQNPFQKEDTINLLGNVTSDFLEKKGQSIITKRHLSKNLPLKQEKHEGINQETKNRLLNQLSNRFEHDIKPILNFYNCSKYDWISKDKSSLSWWLKKMWKGGNDDTVTFNSEHKNNDIINFNNKQYIYTEHYYWELTDDDKTNTHFIKNKNGEQIRISNKNGVWYLTEWEQQKIYIYDNKKELKKIDNTSTSILDEALKIIFKNNPSETINNSLRYSRDELFILSVLNSDNKTACNTLLKLRKMLSLALGDQYKKEISDDEVNLLSACSIPFDKDNIEKMFHDIYPNEIDTEKYLENIHNYYNEQPSLNKTSKKDNLLFIRGIAYAEALIHNSKDSSPVKTFWENLFNITNEELVIKNKNITSPIDKDELAMLNIAKYHVLSLCKYTDTYMKVLEEINNTDVTLFSEKNKNTFENIHNSKKIALSIYYKVYENINLDVLKLNDSQLIIEHDRITHLDNKVSDLLENITSAIFYKSTHPYNISIYDFLKCRVFYNQKTTALIKSIYSFEDEQPQNYISSSNFKTSKECESQSEFTSQFNAYIENGSSEYESKTITPLFLSQLDIYPETLSYEPTRWFTLRLTLEETKTAGLRIPVKSYKRPAGNINIIKLKNNDYIIISALNGDLKVKVIKGLVFDEIYAQEKDKNASGYLPFTNKNYITDCIIGDNFESQNSQIRYKLEIEHEHSPPSLVKESFQKAIHSCLNDIANYKKTQLDINGITQQIAESLIPFYRDFYYKITDKNYKIDKLNIAIDAVFIGSSLIKGWDPLKTIGTKTLLKINNLYHTGKEKKLSMGGVAEFIKKTLKKDKTLIDYMSLNDSLTDIVSPMSYREIGNPTLKRQGDILRIEDEINYIYSEHKSRLNKSQLQLCTQQGRFKGIYRTIIDREFSNDNYYIKNNDDIYQVHWDANLYTWRIIEQDNPIGLGYGPSIKYVSDNKWAYNDNLGLLGSRFGDDKFSDSLSEINLISESGIEDASQISTIPSHLRDNSLFNKEPLRDIRNLKRMNKTLTRAQKMAIKKIKSAAKIVADAKYSSRTHELLKIFTNRQNEQKFAELLVNLEETLKTTKLKDNTIFVVDEESDLLAQISPHAQNNGKYISINYSAYNKSMNNIFSKEVEASDIYKKEQAKENLARTIIHEFSHVIDNTTDRAGYIELLHLNGKHDLTKLLIKSKLKLPESYNNADALTEVIVILSKTKSNEKCLNDFLDSYRIWESTLDKRIDELTPSIQQTVAQMTKLSWNTEIKQEIAELHEFFNIEMSKCLISEIDDNNKIFFDLIEPLNEDITL